MIFDLGKLPADLRPLATAIDADARANPRYKVADLIRGSDVNTFAKQRLFEALTTREQQ